MMRFILVCVVFAIGCGDNRPACTVATQYGGDVVWCDGLPGEAVCMADRMSGPVMCRAVCADTGPACGDGEFWNTMLVVMDDGVRKPICYCEPNPALETRPTLDN